MLSGKMQKDNLSLNVESRYSQYRTMWVIVFFDLPTTTKKDQKAAAAFRKTLLQYGFSLFQFSIYIRFCQSKESADSQIKRLKYSLPSKGKVGILNVTDKQFGCMELFVGKASSPLPQVEQQLELF